MMKRLQKLAIGGLASLALSGCGNEPRTKYEVPSHTSNALIVRAMVIADRPNSTRINAWDNDGDGNIDEALWIRGQYSNMAENPFATSSYDVIARDDPEDWTHKVLPGVEGYFKTERTLPLSQEESEALTATYRLIKGK